MAKQTFTISSIFEGIGPSQYFTRPGNYLATIGIDPDLPITDAVGDRQTSGQIRPSGYASFDGANVNGNVIAILTNPKNALVYVVLSNGRLISYTSAFGSETLIGTVTGSNAEGAFYYNNYIYITGTGASKNDISRYGPLNNSPSLTNGAWTGAALGSQTALVDTTYPSLRGSGTFSNHWGYIHTDDRAYFCDFNAGIGYIHYIKTAKSTDEGDTDDGSQYNALQLPFGFMPMSIALAPGGDMAIIGIQTSNSTLNQGKAMMVFWDGSAPSFYRPVTLPDSLATALLNNNGELFIWSGSVSNGSNVSNGYRVSRYSGGQSIQQMFYSESGVPPMQGAVEAIGNRICWGTFEQIPTTTASSPEYFGIVLAMGSKRHDIPQGVHGIIKASAVGSAADGLVTAIKNVQQSSFSYPKLIVASRDVSNFHIDKQSTTYGTVVFRGPMWNVGEKFKVTKVRIPLGAAIAANMTLVPKIFTNDFKASNTLTTINNTNYKNSQRVVELINDSSDDPINGENNLCLELRLSGTALLPILFPIEVTIETFRD